MFNKLRAIYQVLHDTRLPRSKLDKVINKRLKAVLMSAYKHVPYYREVMKSVGYNPIRDYRSPEDLALLPIITKKIIKQKGIKNFIRENSDLSTCYTDTTSGSTGIPLRIYRTSFEQLVEEAKWLFCLLKNGYSIRDKILSLKIPARFSREHSLVTFPSILQQFGFLRRHVIDYLLPADKMIDVLLEYKPNVLYGHKCPLDLMAMELKRQGVLCDNLKLLIGYGNVIYENTRQLWLKQFGIELTETYGSVEIGVTAYETPSRDGLHLFEAFTLFEFLDENGKPVPPGEPGRLVMTDLTRKLMPFIRYDQGDMAMFKQIKGNDGSIQKRIIRIIGREEEFVLFPGGKCHPFLDDILSKFTEIQQFRIIQKTQTLFHILVVADSSYLRSIHNDLLDLMQQEFPPEVTFEIIQVPRIDPDPSGKIRAFISEVAV
ncbi:phenylacetate--CoA ligase family protein [Acidobacteriota bacterium]